MICRAVRTVYVRILDLLLGPDELRDYKPRAHFD